MSNVNPAEKCPSIPDTVLTSTPFCSASVAKVWRRSWNRTCGSFQIYIRQSTIYVEPQTEDCDMEAAFKAARQVFGIVTVARAVPCAKEMDAIVETAKTYLRCV